MTRITPLIAAIFALSHPVVVNSGEETTKSRSNDADLSSVYKLAPHPIDKARMSPKATGIVLNNVTINHLTQGHVNGVVSEDEHHNTTVLPDIGYAISSEITQAVTIDNVFLSDQWGEYLQLRGVSAGREIRLHTTAPETLQGMIYQATFMGDCSALGIEPSDERRLCSYVPPLVTDRDSIDPMYFVPTIIEQKGFLGQEITPENQAIIALPGFQGTGVNGEALGLDLYFPNLGSLAGNTQSKRTVTEREERNQIVPALAYSRYRQTLASNAHEAIYHRTIRGAAWILGDNESPWALALSGLAQLLPVPSPSLEGGDDKHSTKININLLRAANNSRIPPGSYTLFQVGQGRADHPDPDKLPSGAWFHNLWLGLSPVTQREFYSKSYYVATGPERVLISSGGEGGSGDAISYAAHYTGASGVIVPGVDSDYLDDFYIQQYLTFTRRDVNAITEAHLEEKTTYYPHLGFTGNYTENKWVWRYYSGMIKSHNHKLYLGSDFRYHLGRWSFSSSGIYWHNPDYYRFSHATANISRLLRITDESSLRPYVGARYAFDGSVASFLDEPQDDFVKAGVVFSHGRLTLNAYRYLNLIPESLETNLMGIEAAYRFSNGLALKAFQAPGSKLRSRGIHLEYRHSKAPYNLTLLGGWQNNRYEYGYDPFDHPITSERNIFTLGIQLRVP